MFNIESLYCILLNTIKSNQIKSLRMSIQQIRTKKTVHSLIDDTDSHKKARAILLLNSQAAKPEQGTSN